VNKLLPANQCVFGNGIHKDICRLERGALLGSLPLASSPIGHNNLIERNRDGIQDACLAGAIRADDHGNIGLQLDGQ
jgi:hypothetical protein